MKYCVEIQVELKSGHSDPEGETTARLLRELGYKTERVNVAKVYKVLLEAKTSTEADEKAEEMCKRLLANPTKDSYTITIGEIE